MHFLRHKLFIILAAGAALLYILFTLCQPLQRPAITYFPAHPDIRYVSATTHFNYVPGERLVRIESSVRTREPNQLMQNFSLLYRNNRLAAVLNNWKQNVRELATSGTFKVEDGFYTALTVHQAEKHVNHAVYGREFISDDFLVIMEANGMFHAFRTPVTPTESNWLSRWTRQENEQRKELLRRASAQYHFLPANYRIVTLDELTAASSMEIFPFDKQKTERIVGQLWEGLYKNYVRGFQFDQNQIESPLGSTIPILLIGNDHLLVIIETKQHRIIILRQNLS